MFHTGGINDQPSMVVRSDRFWDIRFPYPMSHVRRDRKRSYRRRVMTITLMPLPEVQMKELIEFTRNVGAKGCALHKPSTLIQLERRFECRSATRLKA